MTDLSPSYYRALALTKRHHAAQDKTFSGRFTWKQRKRIKAIIDRHEVRSILDYGCGKGKQYQDRDPATGQSLVEYWGVRPVLYDPGVPQYAAEPEGNFDLVFCVQVLGSIPAADLPAIIDRLYRFAGKAIFVAERIKMPRKKIFADMQNEMPHGRSVEWWMEMLRRP